MFYALFVYLLFLFFYRKIMTKLNENNVTFVIQTISSMNYFDSSRTYNGNAYHGEYKLKHSRIVS
jgi:lipopolysaccharide export system protein LptA